MMKLYLLNLNVVFFFLEVKGDGGCRHLNFLPCEENKALVGHVVKTTRILAQGLKDCQHQCFLERECVSYNLGPVDGMSRICNLSDTDHAVYPGDVKSVPGAEYCPIRNTCSKNSCPNNRYCKPDFDYNKFNCFYKAPCADLNIAGKNKNGVYSKTPIQVAGLNVQVYCDQQTDGGGWTVIQKRLDGSVDFYREWDDYKRGFGNKRGEYWLGLDTIHSLTKAAQKELRIDLEDFNGNKFYALYSTFKVGTESQRYKLILGAFKEGNADDSLTYHNGQKFSTRDRDNDAYGTSCAQKFKSAWWFGSCHMSHLNGQYLGTQSVPYGEGLNWRTVTGLYKSVKKAEMKIRPVGFEG